MTNKVSLPSRIIIHAIFILFSLVCLIPLLIVVSISLTNEKSLLVEGYRLIPKQFSLTAYE